MNLKEYIKKTIIINDDNIITHYEDSFDYEDPIPVTEVTAYLALGDISLTIHKTFTFTDESKVKELLIDSFYDKMKMLVDKI